MIYFRSGKLLFDKYGRISFCANCECSQHKGDPSPCTWPSGNTLPSCVVIARSNFASCPECTTTSTAGVLPIELYLTTELYDVKSGDEFRLPDAPNLKVFAVIGLDTLACRWYLAIRCKAGVATYDIWYGEKAEGSSPIGNYSRVSGCDTTDIMTVH